MRYIFKKGKTKFETEDRDVFADYIMSQYPDVAGQVRYLGVRYYLAEDNPNPLDELCQKVADGYYAEMCDGDLFEEGLDALITDMVHYGGNLKPDYNFYGIRIEE